jgi:ABC-type phosphate transport system substrate-binding protein
MMRVLLTSTIALLAALAAPVATRASFVQPVTGEALAIIVHRANPVNDLTLRELRRIFMLDMQTWPQGRKITLVLREPGQLERRDAIRLICGMSEADYDRHVLFQTFRGQVGWGPRSIRSAAAMLRFVFNAPGAIGYVRADESDDSVKVLRIGGTSPSDPDYPLQLKTPHPDRDRGAW